MSDATLPSLDIREQIIRIDRAIAETQKYQSESNKLRAEERKLRRDIVIAPWVAAVGGVAGLIAAAITAAKALGWM
jgi:hypothetical protein